MRVVATYEDVFAALDTARVRFVVVGGVAVILHGSLRLTADLDLVIDLAAEEAVGAMEALTQLGLEPRLPVAAREFADNDTRAAWVRDRGMMVFTLIAPAGDLVEVDVFATEPFPFDEMYAAAKVVALADRSVHIASLDHLIAMKRVAGRPQDIADIEALEAIRDD